MTKRLSVNINDECAEALETISSGRGITVTEAIRQAISLFKFMDDELRVKGGTLQIKRSEQGPEKEIVIV